MAQLADKEKPKGARNLTKIREHAADSWLGGEFFDPTAPRSVPRDIAQRQFLIVASELYGVTADLRDNVLPHFVRQGSAAAEEALNDALKNWIDRHHLGQPWVLAQVRETLTLWAIFPKVARLDLANPPWHPLFHLFMMRLRPSTTEPFGFTFVAPNFEVTAEGDKVWSEPAGWHLELERREVFESEARRQFEDALKEYVADQEKKGIARGLCRVKRPRSREFTPRAKIEWTVHRHCGRVPFDQIAERHYLKTGQLVDVSTVIKVVTKLCKLMKLR